MPDAIPDYVREIQAISAVPQLLETVAAITGLGFVAIAHVTENSWNACAVLDLIDFGMVVGDGLDVSTTLCDEVRTSGEAIIIDSVRDSDRYRDHHTPRQYGFESYFALPIFRPDGSYFGTLCGLDPQPHPLSVPATASTLRLFADLISRQLETEQALLETRRALLSERETAELREQFIAVLGHDLRTPMTAIMTSIDLIQLQQPGIEIAPRLERMRRSVNRMTAIVDDVVDFTRGRMGGGVDLALRDEPALDVLLRQVVDELRAIHGEARIVADIQPGIRLRCDAGRIGQLLSNLIKNAVVHGTAGEQIGAVAHIRAGKLVLAVSNQGPHLPPDVVAQLFKPFRRGACNETRDGLGLGLYIVDQIARAHGGTMDVSSAGGTVKFEFSMAATS